MKPQRLDPLLERARSREEAVARELAALARDLSAHEQRLAELRRYAAEYAAPVQVTLNPAELLNRVAFRERVQEAVARQAQAVEQQRHRCEQGRGRLLEAARDTRVLENLAERYRQDEAREAQRREQKQLDELAGRSVVLRRQREESL